MNVKNESADGCQEGAPKDLNGPVILCEFDTELQATALLAELQAGGIDASTTGGFTAGFRAETPGLVQVVVRQKDLVRAKAIWDNFSHSKLEIDWSKVDVGDPED